MSNGPRISFSAARRLRELGWDVYLTLQEDIATLHIGVDPNGIALTREWDTPWSFHADGPWGLIQLRLAEFYEIIEAEQDLDEEEIYWPKGTPT